MTRKLNHSIHSTLARSLLNKPAPEDRFALNNLLLSFSSEDRHVITDLLIRLAIEEQKQEWFERLVEGKPALVANHILGYKPTQKAALNMLTDEGYGILANIIVMELEQTYQPARYMKLLIELDVRRPGLIRGMDLEHTSLLYSRLGKEDLVEFFDIRRKILKTHLVGGAKRPNGSGKPKI